MKILCNIDDDRIEINIMVFCLFLGNFDYIDTTYYTLCCLDIKVVN